MRAKRKSRTVCREQVEIGLPKTAPVKSGSWNIASKKPRAKARPGPAIEISNGRLTIRTKQLI